MNEEIAKLIEKAEHALEVAEKLKQMGYIPDSASKIYYSMFYAAQALLKSENIEVVKHSAVEAAFGYYFAKTGKIDPKYHKIFINSRKIREIADYNILEEIIEPVVELKIEEGREFLEIIKNYIESMANRPYK